MAETRHAARCGLEEWPAAGYGNGRTRDVARLGVGKGATVVESVTRSRANWQTALRGCHAAMPNGRPLMKLSMKTKR
jgi:hypothetical protein